MGTRKSKSQKARNVRVIKNVETPETPEVLAANIIAISASMQKLCGAGGLTEDAVAALICNMRGNSHLNKTDVITVLDNLPKLASYYVKN